MGSKRKKSARAPAATEPVPSFDQAAELLYLEAHTAAAKYGLEVIVLFASPAEGWRAKWGPMDPDRVTLLVFKFLAKLQSLFP